MHELRGDRHGGHLFGEMTSCFSPGRMKPWAELEARPPEAFPQFFFSPTRFICHSVLLPPLLPKTSSLGPNLASAAFTCCADVARCWRDGAAGNSTAGSGDSGKCSHLQSVKGDNKRLTSPGSSWSCRTTSAAEEEECRSLRWAEQLCFATEGRLSSSPDHSSSILRQHAVNCILSTFASLPCLTFVWWNVNVSPGCRCCLWLLPGCFYDRPSITCTAMISLAASWKRSCLLCRG